MKTPYNFLTTVVLAVLFHAVAHSQNPVTSAFWINIWDNRPSDTSRMDYGNNVRATYDLDDSLGEYPCPPQPPGPLYVLWRSIPGRPYTEMGCSRDYRSVPTDLVKRDTFKLSFDEITPDTTIYFGWPDSPYLSARCDSMFFEFVDSTNGLKKIDMLKQQTLAIPAANSRGISYAFIYKFGVKLVDGVTEDKNVLPREFNLEQSCPNPFNPTTAINYQLSLWSHITLKVFDVLGREVTTLVDEKEPAGEHIAHL